MKGKGYNVKKKALTLIVVLMGVLLCACGSNSEAVVEDPEAVKATAESDVKIERASTADGESSTELIGIGDKIVANDFEFTLEGVSFSYDVKPSDTSGYYYSYPAEENQVYIDVKGTYKNTSQRDHCIRDLLVPVVVYDNNYTYQGFAVVDRGDSFDWSGSYVAATPLQTCKYHVLVDCPEEIKTGTGSVSVLIVIEGKTYQYNLK